MSVSAVFVACLLLPNVSNDGTWYAQSSVVITTWRVLRLLMARRPPDSDRGLECKEVFACPMSGAADCDPDRCMVGTTRRESND
jgi:hypothetical protein